MPTLLHPSIMPATRLRYDATMRHHVHLTHYTAAMAFIEAHGHFAAITKDGLLALGTVYQAEMPITMTDPTDDKVELPKVFEVDEDGMVVSREVREWLGY